MNVEAEARCVNCRHTWWVEADVTKLPLAAPLRTPPICPRCRTIGQATGRARGATSKKKATK